MVIFLFCRYLNVLDRRENLSNVIKYYHYNIEPIELPVVIQNKHTAVFCVWEWGIDGMIIDDEIREKIKVFMQNIKYVN